MSQRASGYARQANDAYETPSWVTEALLPHLPPLQFVWEPAAGNGSISRVLQHANIVVVSTDIKREQDFFKRRNNVPIDGIITNPPFDRSREFIERALDLTKPDRGIVAVLLRTDYDHAKTRQHLFGQCRAFHKKLVLTQRIVWFDRPGAAPSFNHAWFIWNWKFRGRPVIAYA